MIKEIISPLRGAEHVLERDPEALVFNLCQRGGTVHLEIAECTVFMVVGNFYTREFRFNTNFARDTFLTFYKNEFRKFHGKEPPRILEAP